MEWGTFALMVLLIVLIAVRLKGGG